MANARVWFDVNKEDIITLKKQACSNPQKTDKMASSHINRNGQPGPPVHQYELMYGMFLMPLRRAKYRPKVFEIGLGCRMRYGAGASALLWHQLLPNSELWEADYDNYCLHKHEESLRSMGINAVSGSQSNRTTLNGWIQQTGGNFDVIIDDGSHRNAHMMLTFQVLWPSLRPGGVYIIEDMQIGRLFHYDTTGGETVMSDVIQTWVDQLAIPTKPAAGTRSYHTLKNAASERAFARRQRFPLPDGVAFIFCQREACVIGKDPPANEFELGQTCSRVV